MTSRPLDAVIIGSGFSGLGAGIQLRRNGFGDFVIIEREDDIGGTWHVNRYPGAGVDIMSSSYQFPFEPNPYWSRLYAKADELKRYADHVADKYDLRRCVRLNTSAEGAVWDEDDHVWRVSLSTGETLTARFLVSASGFLSQRHYPDIPGMESFAGEVLHTTWWDESNDLHGRRVGVIGTGATAVQLVPELAKVAEHLTVYQRTPIWVTMKLDAPVSTRLQGVLARFSVARRLMSAMSDAVYDLALNSGILNHRRYGLINRLVENQVKFLLFLSVRDRETRRKLTPNYSIGCKRPAVSNVYYRTFDRPNVTLHATGIDRIEPDGIVLRDATKAPIDTLVLATGFNVWDHNFPGFETIGRGGVDLGKWWLDQKYASYQGITVPNFPNYIAMTCPWAFTGLSYFHTIEVQMAHMDRLFGEMKRQDANTFEVSESAKDRFLAQMRPRLNDTVLLDGNCAGANSYYFNRFGEVAWFRPTSRRHAMREHTTFPLSDYEIA